MQPFGRIFGAPGRPGSPTAISSPAQEPTDRKGGSGVQHVGGKHPAEDGGLWELHTLGGFASKLEFLELRLIGLVFAQNTGPCGSGDAAPTGRCRS